MKKWKVFEDRWHPVKDDEGRHYLVSEVDEQIATLVARLHTHGDIETDEEEALRGEEEGENE